MLGSEQRSADPDASYRLVWADCSHGSKTFTHMLGSNLRFSKPREPSSHRRLWFTASRLHPHLVHHHPKTPFDKLQGACICRVPSLVHMIPPMEYSCRHLAWAALCATRVASDRKRQKNSDLHGIGSGGFERAGDTTNARSRTVQWGGYLIPRQRPYFWNSQSRLSAHVCVSIVKNKGGVQDDRAIARDSAWGPIPKMEPQFKW